MRGRERRITGHGAEALTTGWELASCPPGSIERPDQLHSSLDWISCPRPMTAAAALRAAGRWSLDGPPRRFDAEDWWYRTRFGADPAASGEQLWLCFDGLATVADVWLNGHPLLSSVGMFTGHERRVDTLLRPDNDLIIRFRALDGLLSARRARPRWRAPMVENQQLRWFRSTLLGRTPGWSPPAAAVGPWREVRLERRRGVIVDDIRLRATPEGVLDVACRVESIDAGNHGEVSIVLDREGRTYRTPMAAGPTPGLLSGRLAVPAPDLWWPHTHGESPLYAARLEIVRGGGTASVDLGEVGFRTVTLDSSDDNFGLMVNGAPIFCRGACWTPLDPVSLENDAAALDQAFDQIVASGMNMLRVGGTMVYETDEFLDQCDRRGVLLWQDFMFANLDYPEDDPGFVEEVASEARQQLSRLQGRPSLAVLCGNSEGEQQAAMWGAERTRWAPSLFHGHLADLTAALAPGVPYWPSSAHGGAFPHQGNAGSTSYYGVGAYLRPLEDARRAEVRFASECLAFANIPDERSLARLPGGAGVKVHHAAWKSRSPRDLGAGWDFDDVRDHYLGLLFGVDPLALRYADHDRYLALGRVATGEVMAQTFGEWRRRRSVTRGGLVWFLRDLWPGAGWGVVDALGTPKAAWHYLRRALAPVALHLSDEGGNGLAVHAVNDRGDPVDGRARSVPLARGRDPGREWNEAPHGASPRCDRTQRDGVVRRLPRPLIRLPVRAAVPGGRRGDAARHRRACACTGVSLRERLAEHPGARRRALGGSQSGRGGTFCADRPHASFCPVGAGGHRRVRMQRQLLSPGSRRIADADAAPSPLGGRATREPSRRRVGPQLGSDRQGHPGVSSVFPPESGPPRAEPRYFGPPDRPLFGWLHRPATGVIRRSTGIVICNPFGYEALSAHRSLRHFAEAAAGRGYPVLRFDYDGTGDSAGHDLDPNRWAAWQRSVHHAIDELLRASGATDACLLGVRLGATVAAMAAQARDDVAGLAVIAPVLSGRLWLREMRAVQATMGRPEPPPEFALPKGVVETVGLLIPDEARAAIGAVDLETLTHPPAAQCLVIDRDDRPPSQRWCEHLSRLGAAVDHRVLPGFVEMVLDPHEALVPQAMVSGFLQWMASQFPGHAEEARIEPVQVVQGPIPVCSGVRERSVFLDESQTLFGVVSMPAGGRPERAVLLLNSGANHHIGTGRMYVKFARRLAERGWLVLRYDVSGIGDSAPHQGEPENVVYTARAVGDLATALTFVRTELGVGRIEVAGLCSGAYFGFKGAVAGLPMQGVTVINPLVFFWKEGMSLAYPPFQMVQAAAQYQRSILRPEKWLKLIRGQVNLRAVAQVVTHRVAERTQRLARNLLRGIGIRPSEDLAGELESVVGRGTALRFVFSVGDPGEALLDDGAGWALARLERRGAIRMAHLPDCDHSLAASWMHELLWRELTDGLEPK